jgi:hypothetical protein
MADQYMSGAPHIPNACPLCQYTDSQHPVFEEIMAYVTDNAHHVHLNELVIHVQAALLTHTRRPLLPF